MHAFYEENIYCESIRNKVNDFYLAGVKTILRYAIGP
jgi:hypothetical protein